VSSRPAFSAASHLGEDAVGHVVDAVGRRLGVQLADAAAARRPTTPLHAADPRHHLRRLATVHLVTDDVVRRRRCGLFDRLRVGVDVRLCSIVDTTRNDTRCCFNVCSKADMSRLNLPHGNDN